MLRASRAPRRRSVPATFAVALACLATPGAAGAIETNQSPREVREYWTAERMASAIPTGPISELGVAPAAARGQASAVKVRHPARVPLRTHGKVFFTQGLLDYVCSGTAVESRTKSLVVTAGHCVHSGGNFSTNFEFVPAYRRGDAPFGEWPAQKLEATPQWKNSEDLRYDVGMATVSKVGGKTLQSTVGARRIAFNRGRDLSFKAYGYPAGDPYNGRSMFVCKSPAQGTDRSQGNPEPTRIDCDQTGGSSGGGWVIKGGKVNSVVSYGYDCDPVLEIVFPCRNSDEGKLFGPYFGDVIKRLYRSEKR